MKCVFKEIGKWQIIWVEARTGGNKFVDTSEVKVFIPLNFFHKNAKISVKQAV